jgi:serine/threonine protein phosphatase PrpC
MWMVDRFSTGLFQMKTWIGIGQSEIGRVRTMNQDAFVAIDHLGIWAVADGMGGHVGGEIAAQTAIETIRSQAVSSSNLLRHGPTPPTDVLTDLISRAHEAVLDRARSAPKFKGMGTTIVILAIVPGDTSMAYFVHVGDSRAYRFRSGTLTPLTKDHTLIEKYLERGILTPESAKTHPERHVLTRALGMASPVKPTIAAFPIQEDDLVLLCSDGLTKMVEDGAIHNIFTEAEHDPTHLCHRLVTTALDHGGEDNVTVVVVAHR